ncbi:MAG: acyl-CoA--6-aminopenicillanic acid acyl-transferase [Ignavibacteria bacterium]|jgi:predicted choloylglycine hydrolase|nr:acyl-CoA--6-aminopenicillanic acid acyl-transferase [Ignavibacteria bacterium]MCU7502923.1 acyl-CoA--6-aminopenicillanic acid acyl-transferase [Ignavibacteria bacterium]MCU7515583.1 acyl-CoA--6-aminopenicillanic acid acyl-transferase [Ignavibacteria bacterium]
MYHPRLKGSHYEMGRKMGEIFRINKAEFPIGLDKFQMEFGRKSAKILKKVFPEAAEEIRGVTDVIGYDNEKFTSWMMCMGCCMYNIDEFQSVEVKGCTAFSFNRNGKIFYARNNDLPPFLKKVCKSEYYEPEKKNRFILNTSSFINGEEGINEHGLVAAMTFVMPLLEEIRPGLNSVFLVRYILENCSSVAEGIVALKSLPIASNCNILLTDQSGSMAVAECNPGEMNLRLPMKNSNGEDFIITVNSFISEKMKRHEPAGHNTYLSYERYQTVLNALKSGCGRNPTEYAKDILSGRLGFMCQYEKKLNFETVWASIFEVMDMKVLRAEGNPGRKCFIEDKRLKS